MPARPTPRMPRLAAAAALLAAALVLGGCQEALYSGLAEQEANQMRQVLLQQGIDASRTVAEDGRFTLSVEKDEIGRALHALEAAGLPSQKYPRTIDVLKTDALVASPAEDRARLGYALSQELSATIAGIDGVVSARVHLALPERPLIGSAKTNAASASVLVRHRPGYNMQSTSLAIRQLVARSVEGLTPEQVSVVLIASDPVAAATALPLADATGAWHSSFALIVGVALGACLTWLGVALADGRRPGPSTPLKARLQALRMLLMQRLRGRTS